MNGEQLSMFQEYDEDETRLRDGIRRGSGYEDGALRIYAAIHLLNENELAAYLKEEFGIGGWSLPDGFLDYDGKGIRVRKRHGEEKSYSWRYIARTYRDMAANGTFPNQKVIDRLGDIVAEYGSIPLPIPRYKYPDERS